MKHEMKQPYFVHVDANSQNFEVNGKVFGRAWSKMAVASLVLGI